jgi:predicted  nucleic acid-binding Zn-ribbon protein
VWDRAPERRSDMSMDALTPLSRVKELEQELTDLKSTYDDLVQRYTTLESNHIGLHKQHDDLKELCNAILKVAEENCDHSDEIMNLKEFMEGD